MFPRLYPIVDTGLAARIGLPPVRIAAAILAGGATILQYRHKGAFTRDRFAEARQIADLCAQCGARFIMNDRADLALLLGCGLHVGQDDLPVADVRSLLPPGAAIGLSTHNEAQFDAAPADLAYTALGPVFATGSKENPDPVVGLDELRRLAARKRNPLVAIGGITLERAPEVWRAGADSIAVISALLPASGGGVDAESGIAATVRRWLDA